MEVEGLPKEGFSLGDTNNFRVIYRYPMVVIKHADGESHDLDDQGDEADSRTGTKEKTTRFDS